MKPAKAAAPTHAAQSRRLAPIALRLLRDQPFLAFRQRPARHLRGNPRNRVVDRLLGADARKTSSLRRLMRHRERVRRPPRSSVRSDADRLRLLDAPSRTAPQDRRAPQDWSYPSPQSLSEAHARTDLPAHRHAHPSRAPRCSTLAISSARPKSRRPTGAAPSLADIPSGAPSLSIPPMALTRPSRSPGPAFPATTRPGFR